MYLRRLFVLLILAPGASAPVLAQNTFGFRLGINVATLTGDFASSTDANSRMGFAAGIYGALPLQYALTLQLEMLYMQKGFQPTVLTLVGNDGSVQELVDTDAALELTYLEIPILIKYTIDAGSFRVDPYLGSFMSVELAERLRIEGVGDGISEQNDDIASPDVGFVLGGDLNVTLGTLDIVLGGRYTRGLTNLLEPSVAAEGRSSDVITSTFSFFVGLNL